jgi:hypothetical protein
MLVKEQNFTANFNISIPFLFFFSFEAFVCSIKSKQTRGTQFQFIISYGPPEYIIKRNTGMSTRRYKTKLQLPSCYDPQYILLSPECFLGGYELFERVQGRSCAVWACSHWVGKNHVRALHR